MKEKKITGCIEKKRIIENASFIVGSNILRLLVLPLVFSATTVRFLASNQTASRGHKRKYQLTHTVLMIFFSFHFKSCSKVPVCCTRQAKNQFSIFFPCVPWFLLIFFFNDWQQCIMHAFMRFFVRYFVLCCFVALNSAELISLLVLYGTIYVAMGLTKLKIVIKNLKEKILIELQKIFFYSF